MNSPQEVSDLVNSIERLNSESADHFDRLASMYKRNRRLMRLVMIGLVLDILLTIFLSVAFYSLNTLTDRVDFSQTVTRRQVLCPLYMTFLQARSAQARTNFPRGPVVYDQLFAQLEKSYQVLNCKGE
jgi:hypothetical protein